MKNYFQSGYKQIFYEDLGGSNLSPFLYLHGGPGTGSYDFILFQGLRLSKFIRIIAIDQRGVLRSEAIEPAEPFGLYDIINDCETLRHQLNIKEWGLIGHSFGGYIATQYKLNHPDVISSIIYECPTFDLASSARSLLTGAAHIYNRTGNSEKEKHCKEACKMTEPHTIWDELSKILNELGPLREELYIHGLDKQIFSKIVNSSGLPQEDWEKANTHQIKLYTEGLIFNSLLGRIPDIDSPMLLIKGESDLVTSQDQIQCFSIGKGIRKVVVIQNSSHFPRLEQPLEYANIIREFVNNTTFVAAKPDNEIQ